MSREYSRITMAFGLFMGLGSPDTTEAALARTTLFRPACN